VVFILAEGKHIFGRNDMWKHIKLITLREAFQRTDPVDSFSLSGPQYLVKYMRIQFGSVEKKSERLFFL